MRILRNTIVLSAITPLFLTSIVTAQGAGGTSFGEIRSMDARHLRDAQFEYQGQLAYDGAPVTATVSMQFRLLNDLIARTPVGNTISTDAVDVVDGVFVIDLDFGALISADAPYWLEITVNGTTLSPCQPIKLARRSNTVARDEADGEHDDAGNTDGAHASNGSPHSAGAPH
ncbi:MAG: hypothetical protein KC983_11225, partial [Phycisphaerales bacterium]|nr:hypothetical protein [Phycisphaerales bacterium]